MRAHARATFCPCYFNNSKSNNNLHHCVYHLYGNVNKKTLHCYRGTAYFHGEVVFRYRKLVSGKIIRMDRCLTGCSTEFAARMKRSNYLLFEQYFTHVTSC